MFKVFVQNEAGSTTKHRHFDKTQELVGTEEVSHPYPYAYGFIVGTTSGDGDNLDCYVLTDRQLTTGDVIDCEPIALLEQHEDGDEDHNVLATPVGEENSSVRPGPRRNFATSLRTSSTKYPARP